MISNAKSIFASRLLEVEKKDAKLAAAIANKELKVADHAIFHTVKANGQSNIKLFGVNSENTGAVSNIHQGRLNPSNLLLVTSIFLYSAVSGTADSTIANAAALDFKSLTPVLRAGRFTLRIGQEELLKDASCELFEQNNPNLAVSELRLESPRFLWPNEEINLEISELAAALPAETWVKAVFRGVITAKN